MSCYLLPIHFHNIYYILRPLILESTLKLKDWTNCTSSVVDKILFGECYDVPIVIPGLHNIYGEKLLSEHSPFLLFLFFFSLFTCLSIVPLHYPMSRIILYNNWLQVLREVCVANILMFKLFVRSCLLQSLVMLLLITT